MNKTPLTVKQFLLKKFPTKDYMDCPVPKHYWETMQEYAELYHAQSTPQVEVREVLTELEWLKLHSGYYGDEIDNVKQLVKINFTGEELYEYCQHMFEMFKQTIPALLQRDG